MAAEPLALLLLIVILARLVDILIFAIRSQYVCQFFSVVISWRWR